MGATLVIVFREVLEAALIIGIVLAATKGVPGRGWWVLAGAEAVIVWADLSVVGSPFPTRPALVAWMFAFVLISYAGLQPPPGRHDIPGRWASAAVPVLGGTVSLGLLVHAALTPGRALTVWLAAGALVTGIVRATLLLAENLALLSDARAEAMTDKLTGLPNRRALVGELASGTSVLRSAHVGAATWLGLLLGTLFKLVLSFLMVGLFGLAMLFG